MTQVFRKFCTVLLCTALAIAIGNMACGDTINEIDRSDEGDGAT